MRQLVVLLFAALTAAAQSTAPSPAALALSPQYAALQHQLARGWNTWDTHSVATQVLLPEGLAIHVGLKHNATLNGDAYLGDALIGRLEPGAEKVTPGPHTWNGSYSSASFEWKGHKWRIQSAHDGADLVLLITPLDDRTASALPPTVLFSVNHLWNRSGTVARQADSIEARSGGAALPIYCTCVPDGSTPTHEIIDFPGTSPYFAAELANPVGLSTGKRRTLGEIERTIFLQEKAFRTRIATHGKSLDIADAIETTLGWDTIYDPEKQRVITPVSRVWSVNWGGYVLFDWDNFFAATLASIGDKDLAYANALEMLREETPQGFVPNYARAGNWKSSDRSEPPVGAITVLGLYRKFHERWLLRDAYEPLLRWNRWWAAHRDVDGYLAWGSDGDNQPVNLDDHSRGTKQGAMYESGLDNSPMFDDAVYNEKTHLLEQADVGLMSLYIADCDALATIADELGKSDEAKELRDRSARYRTKLATLWDEQTGIYLNRNLRTGESSHRLSPTNFYPLLAHAATPQQARSMIEKHLRNPQEFWGQWTIPAIAKNDPAYRDQEYWRGRIWGPMNYLVYLGLANYDDRETRSEFAEKSYALFLKEWRANGHVHENYNAMLGTGDDVASSDRFYHWGALLGCIEYLEQSGKAAR